MSLSHDPVMGVNIGPLTLRQIVTVGIFCFVNLINYMDRYSIAGILTDIQCAFQIGDSEAGLLQSAFAIVFIITAPIFGYLGDRYSRKLIMAFGILLWSVFALVGTFMTNYWSFLIMRALVGVGEASYSILAPAMISDLFVGSRRSNSLALFFLTTPFGGGLGYVVGSQVAKVTGSWEWGIRVIPIAGVVALLSIMLFVEDPPRGGSEGSQNLSATSWWEDIKSLAQNKTFVLTTIGATSGSFAIGALAWWDPKFITLGLTLQPEPHDLTSDDIAFLFGVLGGLSGLIGVPLGSFISQKLRSRFQMGDPIACATALFLSVPLILAALFTANHSTIACFTFTAFGMLSINMIWSVVVDIMLYTVIPTRRSIAGAFQNVILHAFGDAGSPYVIGLVSESLRNTVLTNDIAKGNVTSFFSTNLGNHSFNASAEVKNCTSDSSLSLYHDDYEIDLEFRALEYAFLVAVGIDLIGAISFFITIRYLVGDKSKVDETISGPRTATTSIADDEDDSPVCDEIEIHSETPNDAENVDMEGITNVDTHQPIHVDH